MYPYLNLPTDVTERDHAEPTNHQYPEPHKSVVANAVVAAVEVVVEVDFVVADGLEANPLRVSQFQLCYGRDRMEITVRGGFLMSSCLFELGEKMKRTYLEKMGGDRMDYVNITVQLGLESWKRIKTQPTANRGEQSKQTSRKKIIDTEQASRYTRL